MKDEEKAREIENEMRQCKRLISPSWDYFEGLYQGAIEMADWKTQQAIERVTEFLNGCGDYWYVSKDSDGNAVLDRYSLMKDIIQVLKED